jgi:hypothetical protein
MDGCGPVGLPPTGRLRFRPLGRSPKTPRNGGKLLEGSRSGQGFSEVAGWLAEQAVYREPISGPSSLIYREDTGKSPETGPSGGTEPCQSGPFGGAQPACSLDSGTGKSTATSRESSDRNRPPKGHMDPTHAAEPAHRLVAESLGTARMALPYPGVTAATPQLQDVMRRSRAAMRTQKGVTSPGSRWVRGSLLDSGLAEAVA